MGVCYAMRNRIAKKLLENFKIENIDVIDNSHLHEEHLEQGNDETHFKLVITSEELSRLPKVEAHRKIKKLLHDELRNQIHALEIKLIGK